MDQINLCYDPNRWFEIAAEPKKTLQVFITGRCNAACKTCFFRHHLGEGHMSFEDYRLLVLRQFPNLEKVILLGGEPTLHPQLTEMIQLNNRLGLQTTLYTNGRRLNALRNFNREDMPDIRLSVCGINKQWKDITALHAIEFPITLVFMLDQHNKTELFEVATMAREELGCNSMFITSIRDIVATGSYWKETADTMPMEEYASIVQDFVYRWDKPMTFHIVRRGILTTPLAQDNNQTGCRFLNVLPNGDRIICPFDISIDRTTQAKTFVERKCIQNPGGPCLLQKIVLTCKGA
jgi:MoaA/NifB/PqqE/SkfB family radical SAM enzyme